MHITYTLKTAFAALLANRARSALTILGIVIGIASIMLIAATGSSTQGAVVAELSGLGAETLVVRPGKEPSGPSGFTDLLFSDSLKDREFQAITNPANVPDVVSASPEIIVTDNVSYQGETFRPIILGFSVEFMMETLDLELAQGTIYTDDAIRSKERVAIIGSRVADELFGFDDPIGKNIQLAGNKYRVLGVLAPRGQVVFFNVDELVVIPYSTAQTYITGKKHYNQILVTASSVAAVERTKQDIEHTLRELHNITDPEKDDFNVQTQQGTVAQIQSILGVFTLFLSFVVAIALVVGGIGIMNIMLVSVAERTKEIGLRKAVGATNREILTQFMTESVVLTTMGGIIGVLIGGFLAVGSSFAVSVALGVAWVPSFPFTAAFLGIAIAGATGLIFGLYPARQAAKKSPIEAMIFE